VPLDADPVERHAAADVRANEIVFAALGQPQ
jgi:hypothetical protein